MPFDFLQLLHFPLHLKVHIKSFFFQRTLHNLKYNVEKKQILTFYNTFWWKIHCRIAFIAGWGYSIVRP